MSYASRATEECKFVDEARTGFPIAFRAGAFTCVRHASATCGSGAMMAPTPIEGVCSIAKGATLCSAEP